MTISQVSRRYALPRDTLRYYERIGLIPPVTRNISGHRDYSAQDIRWVEFVKCMRDAGLSIEVLTAYVAMFQEGDETLAARKQLLVGEREVLALRIAEMQKTLDRLDDKIARYEERVLVREWDLTLPAIEEP